MKSANILFKAAILLAIALCATIATNGQSTSNSQPDIIYAKLLQKSEMRKDIVIELSYKGFG